ncbi:hypothetical protein [Streptomyces sp. NPDC055243]|uniref:hypothetical protein n=1 Tax=Streptomyces sp. NPDC055243 TaxID=3365720 RepID=UPI0037D02B7E
MLGAAVGARVRGLRVRVRVRVRVPVPVPVWWGWLAGSTVVVGESGGGAVGVRSLLPLRSGRW